MPKKPLHRVVATKLITLKNIQAHLLCSNQTRHRVEKVILQIALVSFFVHLILIFLINGLLG
jgi:hypothetical protein